MSNSVTLIESYHEAYDSDLFDSDDSLDIDDHMIMPTKYLHCKEIFSPSELIFWSWGL